MWACRFAGQPYTFVTIITNLEHVNVDHIVNVRLPYLYSDKQTGIKNSPLLCKT